MKFVFYIVKLCELSACKADTYLDLFSIKFELNKETYEDLNKHTPDHCYWSEIPELYAIVALFIVVWKES